MYTTFLPWKTKSAGDDPTFESVSFGDGSQLLFYTPTELVTQKWSHSMATSVCGQLLGFGVVLLCTFHRNMIQSLSFR